MIEMVLLSFTAAFLVCQTFWLSKRLQEIDESAKKAASDADTACRRIDDARDKIVMVRAHLDAAIAKLPKSRAKRSKPRSETNDSSVH